MYSLEIGELHDWWCDALPVWDEELNTFRIMATAEGNEEEIPD